MYREKDPNSLFLKLPEIEGGEHIIDMLHEAGLMLPGGMGPVSLSWVEIDAWMRVTEYKPPLWQRLLIKELSELYVSELNKSAAKNCPPPHMCVEEEVVDRTAVDNKLRKFFDSFGKSKK